MSVRPLITEMSVRGEKVSIGGGAQASSMCCSPRHIEVSDGCPWRRGFSPVTY